MEARKGESSGGTGILGGFLWMLGISILLFWLPIFGPIIAGFVGGRKIGSIGKAVVAALLPAFLLAIFSLFFMPIKPSLSILGGSATVMVVMSSIFLLVGAVLGALSA